MPEDKSKHEGLTEWYGQQKSSMFFAPKGHSHFITSLKVLMSLAALVILGLLLIWPLIFTPEQTFNLKLTEEVTDVEENPVMLNPKFHGLDDKSQPYNVNASQAVQQEDDVVHLTDVTGDMTLEDGRWISLSSNEGKINLETKKAKLMGDVNIFSDDGFEFRTEKAYIDFSNNNAYGEDPVIGQGSPGTLNATGFSITDRGENIIFSGPVKMILYPGT